MSTNLKVDQFLNILSTTIQHLFASIICAEISGRLILDGSKVDIINSFRNKCHLLSFICILLHNCPKKQSVQKHVDIYIV